MVLTRISRCPRIDRLLFNEPAKSLISSRGTLLLVSQGPLQLTQMKNALHLIAHSNLNQSNYCTFTVHPAFCISNFQSSRLHTLVFRPLPPMLIPGPQHPGRNSVIKPHSPLIAELIRVELFVGLIFASWGEHFRPACTRASGASNWERFAQMKRGRWRNADHNFRGVNNSQKTRGSLREI